MTPDGIQGLMWLAVFATAALTLNWLARKAAAAGRAVMGRDPR